MLCCTSVISRVDAVQYECDFLPGVLSQLIFSFVSAAAEILEKVGKSNIKLQMVGAQQMCLNVNLKNIYLRLHDGADDLTNVLTVLGHFSLANYGRKPDAKHTQIFPHNW